MSSAPLESAPAADVRSPATLVYFARFTNELLFGAVDVLLPMIRTAAGLSYGQVGALSLVLAYTAYVVDPLLALLIDVWQRRWLLAGGAAVVGLATLLVGLAPTFIVLLVAFALYGIGGGPLAYTADAVLVEGEAREPRRAFARATSIEQSGALLSPALVAAALWVGLEWRWLVAGLGTAALLYAWLLARTRFPSGVHARVQGAGLVRDMRDNIRAVVADHEAVAWLVYLRVYYAFEAPVVYRTIWLADSAGMSQQLISAYVAVVTLCSLAGVVTLERRLAHVSPRGLLLTNTAVLLLVFPAWYLLPGTATRFALGSVIAFLFAMLWPVAKSASLTTESARPGAVTAVNSLTGLLPVTFSIGLLAEVVGLTAASLGFTLGAGALSFVVAWRWLPRTSTSDAAR